MNKADEKVLLEVAELMRKCPAISPNPYEISGTIHACHDFQKVTQLAATIIEKYSVWSANKHLLIKDKYFEGADYVESCEETYKEKLEELRVFIVKRSAEGWK